MNYYSERAREKLCVALDISTYCEVESLVLDLMPFVSYFKVGFQLALSLGAPQVVNFIHRLGGKVFLDLKFHDIHNTVAEASQIASGLEVSMFNVHASAGVDAMKATLASKGASKVLAVTVLTSLDDADTLKIFGRSSKDQIRQFVIDALEAGVDGIICSPKDLSHIKNIKGTSSLFKVTTGLRPEWASKDDQKRTATPREAIYGGADLLVIGRPITCPSRKIGSTIKAAELIHNEVADALRERV